jgi:hypothetical protein
MCNGHHHNLTAILPLFRQMSSPCWASSLTTETCGGTSRITRERKRSVSNDKRQSSAVQREQSFSNFKCDDISPSPPPPTRFIALLHTEAETVLQLYNELWTSGEPDTSLTTPPWTLHHTTLMQGWWKQFHFRAYLFHTKTLLSPARYYIHKTM